MLHNGVLCAVGTAAFPLHSPAMSVVANALTADLVGKAISAPTLFSARESRAAILAAFNDESILLRVGIVIIRSVEQRPAEKCGI